ncbi:MAG: DUF3106 domain-containing protein [Polaromonas sp.]|nr:DUF3106 domain-containing protein [Polaromonas sp.]
MVQAVLLADLSPARYQAGPKRTPRTSVSRLQLLCSGLVFAGLLVFYRPGFAQTAPSAKAAASASITAPAKLQAPAPVTKVLVSRPAWAELTLMQQQTLKPLATNWNALSEAQKRKWLEVSKNYPSLPREDQATMHSRMNEWVALSPQQRAEARLNFAKTKELSRQLTPEEKKAKWQTYQSLSPEEKQKLAANSTTRPVGAALAVKPVAPQKLAAIAPHGVKPPANPLNPDRDAALPAASINTGTTASH